MHLHQSSYFHKGIITITGYTLDKEAPHWMHCKTKIVDCGSVEEAEADTVPVCS
jgi:hypothetical protein